MSNINAAYNILWSRSFLSNQKHNQTLILTLHLKFLSSALSRTYFFYRTVNNSSQPHQTSCLLGLHSLYVSSSLSSSAASPPAEAAPWSCAAPHTLACRTRHWVGNEAPSVGFPHSTPEHEEGSVCV